MLTRERKQKIVEEFAEKFKSQKMAVISSFHGIAVKKLEQLRRILKRNRAEYKVAKKTLLDRALEKAGIGLRTKEAQGEIGIVLNYGDDLTPLKSLVKFAQNNETFKILGGILGTKILSEKEILILAKLPPREILLAQLLGALQSPIRGLARVLQGNIKNLVVALNRIKEKK